MDEETRNDLLGLTAEIVASHVANNAVASGEVATLIGSVHGALATLATPAPVEAARPEPAVPVRASVKHDHLVCLEDGRKLKMLKRYLRTRYDMTPDQYRQRWNLPRDYPMVAPAYAEQRRGLAQTIGLGRRKDAAPAKPKAPRARKADAPAGGDTAPPRRRGRPRKDAAPAGA